MRFLSMCVNTRDSALRLCVSRLIVIKNIINDVITLKSRCVARIIAVHLQFRTKNACVELIRKCWKSLEQIEYSKTKIYVVSITNNYIIMRRYFSIICEVTKFKKILKSKSMIVINFKFYFRRSPSQHRPLPNLFY